MSLKKCNIIFVLLLITFFLRSLVEARLISPGLYIQEGQGVVSSAKTIEECQHDWHGEWKNDQCHVKFQNSIRVISTENKSIKKVSMVLYSADLDHCSEELMMNVGLDGRLFYKKGKINVHFMGSTFSTTENSPSLEGFTVYDLQNQFMEEFCGYHMTLNGNGSPFTKSTH